MGTGTKAAIGSNLAVSLLEKLIKNGSFIKIYSYITRKLDKVKKSNSTSNEGIWKKYEKENDGFAVS